MATQPHSATHGHRYTSVIGPFRTKRAAEFTALFGHNNPHVQHVDDAERLALADLNRKVKA